MIDIKIKQVGQEQIATLTVDNIEITKGAGYLSTGDEPFWASVYDYELSQRAAMSSFIDIPRQISRLKLFLLIDFCDLVDGVRIVRHQDTNKFELGFELNFDFENWK